MRLVTITGQKNERTVALGFWAEGDTSFLVLSCDSVQVPAGVKTGKAGTTIKHLRQWLMTTVGTFKPTLIATAPPFLQYPYSCPVWVRHPPWPEHPKADVQELLLEAEGLIAEVRARHKAGEVLEPIVGVDEAGRGCFAGPLVTCAVYRTGPGVVGVIDSKKLRETKRAELADKIIEDPQHHVWVAPYAPTEIDAHGVEACNRSGFQDVARCATATLQDPLVLVDGGRDMGVPDAIPVVQGDRHVYEIAAASVVAKVIRDRLLLAVTDGITGYAFRSHKGYGTPQHQEEIRQWGAIQGLHRKTFLRKMQPRWRPMPRSVA